MGRFQATLVSGRYAHTRRDKHEFIGPFQLKPGFPKKAEVTFLVENISILSNSGKVPGESL